MPLSPGQRVRVVDALAATFTKEDFIQLLQLKLDREPGEFIAPSDNAREAIDRVLAEASQDEWWQAILHQARLARPNNDTLEELNELLSPPERLSPRQIERLATFLAEGFSRRRMQRLLAERLDRDLKDFAAANETDLQVAKKVLDAANSASYPWWGALLSEARSMAPQNPYLLAFQQEIGQGPQILTSKNENLSDLELPVNVHLWRTRLGEIESRVCRIERPEGSIRGTGFLIAADIVLTNYHVVEDAAKEQQVHTSIVVRFDHKETADGVSTNLGKVYSLEKDNWLMDYSPFSLSDLSEGTETSETDEALDYALLKIAGRPGDDPVGGNTRDDEFTRRGWVEFPSETHDFSARPCLYLVQCPDGGPMKVIVDPDAVVSVNAGGDRVTYTTSIEAGSSGSPCFNEDWDWVAIHQARDPRYPQFVAGRQQNQGIPAQKIRERLERNGVWAKLIGPRQPERYEVVVLGSPTGDFSSSLSSSIEELTNLLEGANVTYIPLENRWAEKSHPELAIWASAPTKPIFLQPVEPASEGFYRLNPNLLKDLVEKAAGDAVKEPHYLVWLPKVLPADGEVKETGDGSGRSAQRLVEHESPAEVLRIMQRLLGRLPTSIESEKHPAFGYQKICNRILHKGANNIIRDVIIPEISEPLREKYSPPQWEPVFFSSHADAKKIIMDLKYYPFAIIALNNFNGDIDYEGIIPEDFRDKILAFDTLIRECAENAGIDVNNILRIGIIATTQPDKHLFRYLRAGAYGTISGWRFVAVSVDGDSRLQVKAEDLNSLCDELQDFPKHERAGALQ